VVDAKITFYCAAAEAEAIAMTLRSASGRPVHVRSETVYGHDFGDARVSEQVVGTLQRAAVELIVERNSIDTLVAKITEARRAQPVRWVVTPVLARGRIT
jgi:hypothetical protein